MSINYIADSYLQNFFDNVEFRGGISFRTALYQCKLDYSTDSLKKIDLLLDQIRNRYRLSEEAFLKTRTNVTFLHLLAYYIGKTIAINARTSVTWYTYDELVALDEDNQLFGRAFYSSFMCMLNQPLTGVSELFVPLNAMTQRLFDEHSEKSVWVSACAPLERLKARRQPYAIDLNIDLVQCVRNLSPEEKSYTNIPRPSWANQDDLGRAFDNFPTLLRDGRVVWGHIVQANSLLFSAGDVSCPGDIVYDPTGQYTPVELGPIADQLYELKGRLSEFDEHKLADRSLFTISAYLANEYTRAFGYDVPSEISAYPLKISTSFFYRPHLPGGFLNGPILPIIISEKCPGSVMVLPGRWWPRELSEQWV